ncbi:DUF805 domain-containing protein [Turicimonas muris]|uniref:DUF805 domain-containing protein n=2 Tax=Turicimonas muris TaxID=1796652 RepID=UPI0025725799|nr:DUF805 domain-containing protein [Turicimonas muris]
MLSWYRYCLKKYFDFNGRASRAEFWSFALINIFVLFSFSLLTGTIHGETASGEKYRVMLAALSNYPALVSVLTILEVLFCVFIFCPALAVTVRRLHDRNHSGWWAVGQFIPFLNFLVLIFLLLDSEKAQNKYGAHAPASPDDVVHSENQNSDNFFSRYLRANRKSTYSFLSQHQGQRSTHSLDSSTSKPLKDEKKEMDRIVDELLSEDFPDSVEEFEREVERRLDIAMGRDKDHPDEFLSGTSLAQHRIDEKGTEIARRLDALAERKPPLSKEELFRESEKVLNEVLGENWKSNNLPSETFSARQIAEEKGDEIGMRLEALLEQKPKELDREVQKIIDEALERNTSELDFPSETLSRLQSRKDKWDEIMRRLKELAARKPPLSQDELDREALVALLEVLGRN